MKNILIGGVPQSGKSTLANLLLRHHGYSVLRGDKIMSALVRTHPEINIARKPDTPEQAVRERAPYLLALLAKLTRDDDIPYVLDSTLLGPEVVRQRDDLSELCTPVFLGYPNATSARKLEQIKSCAPNHDCLSHEIAEPELVKWIDAWIAESRTLQEQCVQYGYVFVDTSHDFDGSLMGALDAITRKHSGRAPDNRT